METSMNTNMKKLLIWDFDGVIADSEKLWVQNWVDMLKNEYNIALTQQQTKDYIVGVSEKTKISPPICRRYWNSSVTRRIR